MGNQALYAIFIFISIAWKSGSVVNQLFALGLLKRLTGCIVLGCLYRHCKGLGWTAVSIECVYFYYVELKGMAQNPSNWNLKGRLNISNLIDLYLGKAIKVLHWQSDDWNLSWLVLKLAGTRKMAAVVWLTHLKEPWDFAENLGGNRKCNGTCTSQMQLLNFSTQNIAL